MTKLYHGPNVQGWQVPGQQDRKATRVDVPSAPAELATWLNDRYVSPEPNQPTLAELLVLDQSRQQERPEPPPQQAPAAAQAQALTTDAILEFILDQASVAQVESIMAAIGTRFAELRAIAGQET